MVIYRRNKVITYLLVPLSIAVLAESCAIVTVPLIAAGGAGVAGLAGLAGVAGVAGVIGVEAAVIGTLAAKNVAKTLVIGHLGRKNLRKRIRNRILNRRIDTIELEPFLEERRYELEFGGNGTVEVDITTNPLDVDLSLDVDVVVDGSTTKPLDDDLSLNVDVVLDGITTKPLDGGFDVNLNSTGVVVDLNSTEIDVVVDLTANPLDDRIASKILR